MIASGEEAPPAQLKHSLCVLLEPSDSAGSSQSWGCWGQDAPGVPRKVGAPIRARAGAKLLPAVPPLPGGVPCFPAHNLPGEPEEPTPMPGWASRGASAEPRARPWCHIPGLGVPAVPQVAPSPAAISPRSHTTPVPTFTCPSTRPHRRGKSPTCPPGATGDVGAPSPSPDKAERAHPMAKAGSPRLAQPRAAPRGAGGWGEHGQIPAGAPRDVRGPRCSHTHAAVRTEGSGSRGSLCLSAPQAAIPGQPPWLPVSGAGSPHGPYTHGCKARGR